MWAAAAAAPVPATAPAPPTGQWSMKCPLHNKHWRRLCKPPCSVHPVLPPSPSHTHTQSRHHPWICQVVVSIFVLLSSLPCPPLHLLNNESHHKTANKKQKKIKQSETETETETEKETTEKKDSRQFLYYWFHAAAKFMNTNISADGAKKVKYDTLCTVRYVDGA